MTYMARMIANAVWDYFEKDSDDEEKRATCHLCKDKLSYNSTISNLKHHLKHRHHDAYVELCIAQQQARLDNSIDTGTEKVFYVVASSPTSSVNNDPIAETLPKSSTTTRKSSETRNSVSERRKRNTALAGGAKDRKLIEQLTEEKIKITSLQKDVIEREMEEKTLRLQQIREEMEHKRQVYLQEKQDMEHKKLMNELEKQEKLLKIEILKANLENIKKNGADTSVSLPQI